MSRLENLQYRAAKIVSGALHFTSKEKIYEELGWETLNERGNLLSLNIFHKIHLFETRPLIRNCMPILNMCDNYEIRNRGVYNPFPHKGDKFNLSFFPNTTKFWNSVAKQIQVKPLEEFKIDIKNKIKPAKYKHFSRGTKLGNTLLTRIRVGRSMLNQHRFTFGHADSPECLCHYRSESPEHYFLDCFLYSPERQILYSLIEHYVPYFSRLTKKKKLDLILRGVNIDDAEFLSTNTTVTKAVQNFILKTNRFSITENDD